jgi:hypothetical protein
MGLTECHLLLGNVQEGSNTETEKRVFTDFFRSCISEVNKIK